MSVHTACLYIQHRREYKQWADLIPKGNCSTSHPKLLKVVQTELYKESKRGGYSPGLTTQYSYIIPDNC